MAVVCALSQAAAEGHGTMRWSQGHSLGFVRINGHCHFRRTGNLFWLQLHVFYFWTPSTDLTVPVDGNVYLSLPHLTNGNICALLKTQIHASRTEC